jgi:hypothetical protein
MSLKELDGITNRFLKSIKLYWQSIFLFSVLVYGLSFLHRMDSHLSPKVYSWVPTVNWISFFIALFLAYTIFHNKRRYFSLKSFRIFFEKENSDNPGFKSKQLLQRFTRFISRKLKMVWLMGGGIVVLGVIYYWLTFDAWNMHVYFIVGLYSLVINYPRKDLFLDIPYLIHEIVKEPDTT